MSGGDWGVRGCGTRKESRSRVSGFGRRRGSRYLGATVGFIVFIVAMSALPLASADGVSPSPSMPCGCTCLPGGCGGGGCTVPIVANDQARVVNGYEAAWVYWNYSGSYSSWTPAFSWSGGAVPLIYKSGDTAWVNLNDLTPGTTYSYVVEVIDACSSAKASGSFSTSNAPTNEFVGWVFQLVSNSYELDPVGSAIPGTPVWPVAVCPVGYISGSGDYQGISFADRAFGLPAASTSSSGYYQLSLPDTYTTTLSFWTGGPHGYEVTDTETITLSSGGSCVAALDGSVMATTGNSEITLYASQPGYFNATLYVSSTLSSSNDYRQFGLLPNFGSMVPVGLALIHTTISGVNYDNAACDFTWTSSTTQATVQQDIVLGIESGQTETSTALAGWNVNGGVGVDDGLSLDYPISGVINETGPNPNFVPSDTWVVGGEFGDSGLPYTTSDSMSDPHYLPSAAPGAGWMLSEPPINGSTYPILFDQGTYSSTTGFQSPTLSISGSWDGVSMGTTISVQSSVTVSTSISNTLQCPLSWHKDPSGNGGNPYFWIYVGNPSSAVVHIWLEGWCGGSGGEPKC